MRYDRRDTSAPGSRGVRDVKSAPLRIWLEGVGYPDHGFGRAQHQHAIGFEHPRKPIEDASLGFLVEIDQDVATENHIERSKMGKILQQVQLPVLHHAADIRAEL